MSEVTVREMQRRIVSTLTPSVGTDEALAMAREMLCAAKGYSPTQLAINGDRTLLPETCDRLMRQAERIAAGEPLQYVLGQAWHHGRLFKVTPDVLIPRPETSQLIDLVVDDLGQTPDRRILDVGTGSGCIAVSLALDVPFSRVTAIDISAAALAVARENAAALCAKVDFIRADILNADLDDRHNTYDCIVSNPPYVLESERGGMDERVYGHEPALALFVPDSDPVLYYRAIGEYGRKALADGGKLWFEINPLCTRQVVDTLVSQGYDEVEAMSDYKGNTRFVRAVNP